MSYFATMEELKFAVFERIDQFYLEVKMKKEKISFICYLIASICFYISAVLDIINKEDNWVIGLCLGTVFLCLSSTHLSKDKGKDKEDQKK